MQNVSIDSPSFSLKLGALLAMSAGLMDAYSFLCRGGVWANAQTGNIVLLGVSLATNRLPDSVQYAVPIAAFGIGVAFAYMLLHMYFPHQLQKGVRWVIGLEIIGLSISALISENLYANALISLVCGMQLEAFPVINGYPMATTMCVGNYRTAVRMFMEAIHKKNPAQLKMALNYALMIALFIGGAIIGNYLIDLVGRWAIGGSSVLLVLALPLAHSPCEHAPRHGAHSKTHEAKIQ